MKYVISAIANWNTDPIISSLLDDNNEITLYCLRKPYNIPFRNIKIHRPLVSFLIQSLNLTLLKFGWIKGEIYESKLFVLVTFLYDLEVSAQIRFRNKFDVIITWASGSRLTLRVAKKLGKICFLFNGNSHIQQQQEIQHKYANIDINNFFIKQQLAEYKLADKILVESEYSKRTYLERGLTNSKLVVLDIPVILPVLFKSPNLIDTRKISHGNIQLNICFVSPRKIKGLDIFMNLVEIANTKNEIPIVFTVFGEVKEKADQEKIARFKNVYIKGNSSHTSFLECLYQMDLILIPTYEDGGPRVLTESVLLGVYAVGSKYSKLPELEKHGIAKVIHSNSPEEYYQQISFYYESINYNKDYSRKVAEEIFDSKKLSKKINNIFAEVKSNGP